MIEHCPTSWLFDGDASGFDSRVLDQGQWWLAPDQSMVRVGQLAVPVRQQLLADLLAIAFDVRLVAMVDATLRMDAALTARDRIEYRLASDRIDQLSAPRSDESWLEGTPLAQALGAVR